MAHILVIDDDHVAATRAAPRARGRGPRRIERSERRARAVSNGSALTRHRGAGHRASGHGWPGSHATPAPVERRADHHSLGDRRRSRAKSTRSTAAPTTTSPSPSDGRTRSANSRGAAQSRRRSDPSTTADLDLGSLHVDFVHHEVHHNGEKVDLTPKSSAYSPTSPARRSHLHLSDDLGRRVGNGIRRRGGLRPRVRAPPPPKTRRRERHDHTNYARSRVQPAARSRGELARRRLQERGAGKVFKLVGIDDDVESSSKLG